MLSACASDLIDRQYDEALTLATAFLAAGAVSVVGTSWAIEDAHAAMFTYAFHYHLSRRSLPPADALQATQSWMLDADRQPFPGMPSVLARYAADPELAHVSVWAAFAHRGC